MQNFGMKLTYFGFEAVFPNVNPSVLEQFRNVDCNIDGMGSLFTSICPSLVLLLLQISDILDPFPIKSKLLIFCIQIPIVSLLGRPLWPMPIFFAFHAIYGFSSFGQHFGLVLLEDVVCLFDIGQPMRRSLASVLTTDLHQLMLKFFLPHG